MPMIEPDGESVKPRHPAARRPSLRQGDYTGTAPMAASAAVASPNQCALRRMAAQTRASITGTSISGPTTVARATVGEKAVMAMAIAISKSRPVELKATARRHGRRSAAGAMNRTTKNITPKNSAIGNGHLDDYAGPLEMRSPLSENMTMSVNSRPGSRAR